MEGVSVIIPNYNKSKFIGECLDSVLNQTYKCLEIIVVDDCSTDGSMVFLQEIEKKYSNIRVISLKKNRGVSYARNIGAREAKYDIITFLDSDDIYYNAKKIQNEVNCLNMKKSGNHIVAYSTFVYLDESGKTIRKPTLKKNLIRGKISNRIIYRRFDFQYLPRDYCMYKSDFFESGGYKEQQSLYEDLDFMIRLSKRCKFVPTYAYGTGYRKSLGSLSDQSKENLSNTLNKVCALYQHKNYVIRYVQKIISVFYKCKLLCVYKLLPSIISLYKNHRK